MEFRLRPLGFMEIFAKEQSSGSSTLHIILHLVQHKPTE